MFRTSFILKFFEIPRERFNAWIVEGFIVPSMPAPKQGKTAYFTRADIYKIAAFKRLIEAGIKREIAVQLINHSANIPFRDNFITIKVDWIELKKTIDQDLENYSCNVLCETNSG